MGCIWSSQESQERCQRCNRRGVNNLIIIDHVCEICIIAANKRPVLSQYQNRPYFGEFRCSCGRTWCSRWSWPNKYQICKCCKKSVYAYTQRELRASDMTHGRYNKQEHKKELCQMCQQIGYHCGNIVKNNRTSKDKTRKKRY